MEALSKTVVFERASGVFLTTRCKCLWHKELSKNSPAFKLEFRLNKEGV